MNTLRNRLIISSALLTLYLFLLSSLNGSSVCHWAVITRLVRDKLLKISWDFEVFTFILTCNTDRPEEIHERTIRHLFRYCDVWKGCCSGSCDESFIM